MKAILLILILMSAGCSMRIFKAEVPSAIFKTEDHLNSEKVSADYIARTLPQSEIKQVAVSLSSSLGVPEKSNDNPKQISNNLNSEITKFQSNQKSLNEKLIKYSGKEIEGTGIDISKPFSITAIILLIVAVVAFPSLISLLFYLLKQSRSAIKAITEGIENFSASTPESAFRLKQCLSSSMDKKHKQIVSKAKH